MTASTPRHFMPPAWRADKPMNSERPMTRPGNTFATFARRNSMLIILIALYILVAFTARGFMSIDNQLNILRTIAVPGMIAFGMTLLIIVVRSIFLSGRWSRPRPVCLPGSSARSPAARSNRMCGM